MDKRDWSIYQKKIFKDFYDGVGHTIIEAYAGAGKTSTLVQAFKYVPKGKKIIALAFNRAIAKELREKAPSYVDCFTTHSLGMSILKKRFPELIVDDNKAFNIVKEFDECLKEKNKLNYELIFSLCDTMSYCKAFLNDTPSFIDELMYQFNVDHGDLDRKQFISLVIKALGESNKDTSRIDFDDMCYLPFVYNLSFPLYDLIAIDEMQDLSRAQLYMAKKCCKKEGGRIIALGDFFQNLYHWRGADATLIDELKEIETTKTLILPISYRCPKKVIELVKAHVSNITCPDATKDGEINTINIDRLFDLVKPGCFILSRTNAPLIKICMELISKKIKANIKGKDVSKHLKAIIKKSKKKRIDAFLKWLEKWKDDELEKIKGKRISPDIIIDKYECLKILCEEAKDLNQVTNKITELFNDSDEKNIVILGTVHAVKGNERDDVFVLKWTFWKWFHNMIPDDKNDMEGHVAYVACSRARDKLYLVEKPK